VGQFTLFGDWPFVAKNILHSIFLVLHLPIILHPCQHIFHPEFSFILATQDPNWMHFLQHQKLRKLRSCRRRKKRSEQGARPSAAAAASFVDGVSLLLRLLVLLSSTTGVWSFFALFQQPSSRV
jgi:hypothetical protein